MPGLRSVAKLVVHEGDVMTRGDCNPRRLVPWATPVCRAVRQLSVTPTESCAPELR